MELKPYQKRVIDDLSAFLGVLQDTPHMGKAFHSYWLSKGMKAPDAYKNNVPGVPHICIKVPTAGGKTFIAVNALKTIFDAFSVQNPDRPQVVIWLVPSRPILDQTFMALSDPEHPYHRCLGQLFRPTPTIFQRQEALMGAGFSPDTVRRGLSIIVMTFDSLRVTNKENRKAFQENSYLASFLLGRDQGNEEWLLPNYDASALINVLRMLNPIVVVDESHNAETPLSVDMLKNLNPAFILDLTATPRNHSNIISYVDAMALKRHHMVKLPVIVANRNDRTEVIESAILLRRQLEMAAEAEEKRGGKYIRPIVLFQAQANTGDDKETFDALRKRLVDLNIPEDQIKIKTANINELADLDLMSRDCPVRYVITINALKEGWDCPFAYILASLGDRSSIVDVEQILGRVLRMPHVQLNDKSDLNMSYVFIASRRFMDTLQSVVRGLNQAGFSDKDYRAIAPAIAAPQSDASGSTFVQPDLLFPSPQEEVSRAEIDDDDWPVTSESPRPAIVAIVDEIKAQATAANQAFEEQASSSSDLDVPKELEGKMRQHKMKEIFHADALSLLLPQFHIKVTSGGFFDEDDALQILEKDELLNDFKLSQADSFINFDDVSTDVYRVDLEKSGDENYTAKPFKLDEARRRRFNSIILGGSKESQIRDVSARLMQLIGNMYPITDGEVRAYIQRIVESMSGEQIRDCIERDLAYVRKIKEKIGILTTKFAEKKFCDDLDVGRISLKPSFGFSPVISPNADAPALPKSLYATEGGMGKFESGVINEIANLDSILWWHRNFTRGKGFRINGFLNHYPDFIVKMVSGKTLLIEAKGDDRDNSDSDLKIKLGRLWAAKAGENFRYMMIFENKEVEGADTLGNALKKIRQL
jgi:type III restriction enzyme